VLTEGKSHTQNTVDGCMSPVTKSKHLPSPYYHQLCCIVITTDS